jgi:small-conductance mechanosensitive channel
MKRFNKSKHSRLIFFQKSPLSFTFFIFSHLYSFSLCFLPQKSLSLSSLAEQPSFFSLTRSKQLFAWRLTLSFFQNQYALSWFLHQNTHFFKISMLNYIFSFLFLLFLLQTLTFKTRILQNTHLSSKHTFWLYSLRIAIFTFIFYFFSNFSWSAAFFTSFFVKKHILNKYYTNLQLFIYRIIA